MKFKLTMYGLPQVVVFPALVLAAMTICLVAGVLFLSAWAVVSIESLLAIVLVFVLAFFRDPSRAVPQDDNLLLAPADGRITDIQTVENDFIGGPALRFGIFLSIFDVHINRAPCSVTVEKITYKKGEYKNAANLKSGRVNESNSLELIRTNEPDDRLIVRQISGAIARRIVCRTQTGEKLSGGEKFGMIKFGSRTELYVPAREDVKCLVQIGDRVKAGLSPLVRYEECPD